MALDTQMPAWLGERAARWNANTAIEDFKPFTSYMRGKAMGLAIENQKLNLASGVLGLQQQEQGIELTKMKMQDQEKANEEFPAWLKETGGDWRKVLETPFTGTSMAGAEMADRVTQAAWMRQTQADAQDLRRKEIENKLEADRQKAENDRIRLDMMRQKNEIWANIQDRLATVQEQKAAAAKNGKNSEFEAIQADWQATMTAINNEDDPKRLALLLARQRQDEDRMKKLSTFASEIPVQKTTVETTDATTGAKTTKSISEPLLKQTPKAATISTNKNDPLGLFK